VTARPVVVVTGGTGALGKSVVAALSAHYLCVVAYRNAASWERFRADLGDADVAGVLADPSDRTSFASAIDDVAGRYGVPHALVHLVGAFETGGVEDASPDSWKRMISANVYSAAAAIAAIIPHLRRNGGGRIVAIGSSASLGGLEGAAAYVVSKAALNALLHATAREHARDRITANVLLPSALATNGNDGVPPERVARSIDFLLSEAGASVTGSLIPLTA